MLSHTRVRRIVGCLAQNARPPADAFREPYTTMYSHIWNMLRLTSHFHSAWHLHKYLALEREKVYYTAVILYHTAHIFFPRQLRRGEIYMYRIRFTNQNYHKQYTKNVDTIRKRLKPAQSKSFLRFIQQTFYRIHANPSGFNVLGSALHSSR